MTARRREENSEAGFTLIEALVALALTGLVLSALATLTAQFLPNWNRGIDRIQHSELIGISMRRIAADLAAAEFIPAGSDEKKKPLFEGTPLSVTFVRTAIGPNAGIGLDLVRIGETTDRGYLVTVRSRAGFTPLCCCVHRWGCPLPMPGPTRCFAMIGTMPTSCRLRSALRCATRRASMCSQCPPSRRFMSIRRRDNPMMTARTTTAAPRIAATMPTAA